MKKCFLLLILAFQSAFAQDFNHYQPLRSSGEIPKEVISLSSEKYEVDKEKEIKSNDSKKVKKAKDKFLLESHFHVDAMLRSGMVLFNDPLSQFVEKVGNELIKNEPSLKGTIHFHVLRSTIPNALATHEGYIFVTMGLLSRLNNEAELAFILSHELTHFVKKHSINEVVNNSTQKSNRSDEEAKLSRCAYSRELESEADMFGLSIFKKSKYHTDAALSTMDILAFCHTPFADIPFPTSFFESEGLFLDSLAFLSKIDSIKSTADKEDTLSTHPNLAKRKAALIEQLKDINSDGKELFVTVDAAQFLNLRKIARFELPALYLNHGMFCESLYYSWILLQDDPESEYLKGIVLRSLYGAAKLGYYNKLDEVIVHYSDLEGQMQTVSHVLHKSTNQYITVLAIKKMYEHLKKNPEDTDVKRLFLDLFSIADSVSEFKEIGNQDIKKIKEEEDNYHYGLSGILKDPLIEEGFSYATSLEKTKLDLEEKLKQPKKNKDFFKLPENQHYVKDNVNYALNISKVVVVEPIYIQGDVRKKTTIKYEASEKTLQECIEDMQIQAKKLDLNVDVLSPYAFKTSEIEKFNLLQDLKDLSRNLMFLESEKIFIEPFYYSKLEELGKQMGTDYFMFSGVAAFQVPKSPMTKVMLYMTMIYIVTIPVNLILLARPTYQTNILSIVYDIKTGKTMMKLEYLIKSRDHSIARSQYFYHIFNQIKRNKP